DTTGCGDSFSAGFLYGMHHFDNPATALACGTLVAAVNAQHAGIEVLTEAPALLKAPRSHFETFAGKPDGWCGDRL
ncbi:MAG: hypothetical protein GY851_19140, partial [bacterium]|nr:hypothetical protein [bacterium]